MCTATPARGRGSGSVTERLLYIPVPAPRCMQDVNRGEVAPWVMCGHREGHSKAWPAVRMRGRGLDSNLVVTLPKARAMGNTKQTYTLKASSLLDRKSLSVCLLGFDNRKAQGEFVEHP